MSEHPVVEYLRTNSVASLERLGIYARWSTTVHPEKFSPPSLVEKIAAAAGASP